MDNGQIHFVHLVLHVPERADRALEHRRVGNIKAEAGFLQQQAGLLGFKVALFCQVDVDPACESVLLVPRGFAVADEH
jgi:hypothetical protein